MSKAKAHKRDDEEDGMYEWCEVCGKRDAMYLSEGEFMCESTGTVYEAW